MAYTVIEVQKLTGVSSHTIRFWAKKGLLPFVQKDKNLVKYFSITDVEWVRWISCLRSINMSLKDIKTYIYLSTKGIDSAPDRKKMLENQLENINKEVLKLEKAKEMLKYKIGVYDKIIKTGIDEYNPESRDYQKKTRKNK
ncbi:MerR family transcriptional regulator [Campylobacter sp. LR286c]|uniref:MerR family transcriptional regulator n=1 Tax=Campylobacter sp. LR286c TaxID=2593545 RepID=UPI001237C4F0|nr:MerR family transcriptional regulator [Campylobacter sp. LR286c]KAA6229183.1 MerR family transcriptional regulator [Campylobacter sp. LR286c]